MTSSNTKEPKFVDVEAIDLGSLDLSTRTSNCMIQANIATVGELARLTEADVLRIPNAGRKTLKEVREILGSLGLKLQGDESSAAPINQRLFNELRAYTKTDAKTIRLETAAPDVRRRLSTRLSSCITSRRAKGVFTTKKLVYVGDLIQLRFRDLLKVDNAGQRTANELLKLVRSFGFELETPIEGWSKEIAERFEKDFASEHARARVEKSNALLATLGPEPSHLAAELSRIALTLATGRNHSILISLWGWDGSPPKTLDAVGAEQSPRLTRERIRQIEAKAIRRLRSFSFETPMLQAAIAIIGKMVPALGGELNQALQHEGICSTPFSMPSIKKAADILGVEWPFVEVTVSGQRIVVRKEDASRVVRLMQVVRRRTSELGCSNILALASALKIDEEKADILRKVLDAVPGIRWLDEDKNWLFLKDAPRNRLFNLSAKVLGVCPRLNLSELRRAVSKSKRLTIAPPQKVLASFVEEIELGTVDGNIILANPTKTITLQADSVEGKIVEVFRKYGAVMDGEELAERCIEHGVNPTSFYIYRLISPVITNLGRGVYSLVGSDVAPGTIERILSSRKSAARSSDHGWLPNGNLWFGFELKRIVLTAGSIRLVTFVSDLVQGDWTVRLADGQTCGTVTCNDAFIRSFRRAFVTCGAEPEDFVVLEFNHKLREVCLKTGGPDLFESIQQENSSIGDDLEGKEIISEPDDDGDDDVGFSHEDLIGDDKNWHPISIAPAEQDLEVRLEDSFGRYVLLFPCRFVPGKGWINSQLKTPLPGTPVDWRPWDEASLRL